MRQFSVSSEPDLFSEPDQEEIQEILGGLNEEQQQAVQVTDGPVLIIAGPGSGKTRTLTHRIAYLIATGKAEAYQILSLTFTNKAAREMKTRVEVLVGEEGISGMWMGTFHSTFARLLRREGEKIGYSSDFSIYDTEDSRRIIKDLAQHHHIDTQQFRPRSLHHLISGAKNRMMNPVAYADVAHGQAQQHAATLFEPYQKMLKRANAMDFDDLLLKPIQLFREHPDVLKKYQNRWRYLHIDEYQDTNQAQYELAKLLASEHRNLCVVGDDAQSIYAFRGADITNILSFQKDYDDAQVVRLERNYRSTKNILKLADSIIDHNTDQLEKSLWTDNDAGDPVVLMEALSEKDEAQKVERTVRNLQLREGYTYDDFAVLYRTNAQSRSLENELRRAGIPYRIIGGTSFYQRKEIKDVLAYLRLVVNPADRASLQRVINYPKRGIGKKTQERLETYAREKAISIWEAVQRAEEIETLSGRAVSAVDSFRVIIDKHAEMAEEEPAEELAQSMILEAGLNEELKKDRTRENLVRWENVQELISAIAEFTSSAESSTLSSFLQEVSLMTDQDNEYRDQERVTLMTLHASKGLEFPVVFVTGLEEDLFPLAKAAEDQEELEEERRLFYVGATRAEQRLYLSHARSRFRYGEQKSATKSRFLDEIDPDVIRTEAGGSITQKKNRFKASGGSTSSYDSMEPHYYRQNLRDDQENKTRRVKKKSSGRQVVYDEGEGKIVPGVRVEHSHFGEGKVLSMDGAGEKATAVVYFGDDVGQKKLKLKFARLRLIG